MIHRISIISKSNVLVLLQSSLLITKIYKAKNSTTELELSSLELRTDLLNSEPERPLDARCIEDLKNKSRTSRILW